MSKQRRILFISRLNPASNGGGSELRAMQHLANLAQFGDVDLLLHSDPGDRLMSRLGQDAYTISKTVQDTADYLEPSPASFSMRLFQNSWGYGGQYIEYSRKSIEKLCKVIDKIRPDLIFASQLACASLGRILKVKLDLKDVWFVCDSDFKDFGHLWEDVCNAAANQVSVKTLRLALNALKVRQKERAVLNASDAVVCCSPLDVPYFKLHSGGRNVVVIPNWLPNPPQALPFHNKAQMQDQPKGNTAIFVGTFSHPPNAEALEILVTKIWPEVRKRTGLGHKLLIVGSKPPRYIMDLNGNDGIVVTGFVQEVKPYYEEAVIALCPLIRGTGTSLKIVEAMAFGRPILGFRACLERPGFGEESGAICVDSNEQFIEKLSLFLSEPELARSAGMKSRSFVEKYFTEERIRESYKAAINQGAICSGSHE